MDIMLAGDMDGTAAAVAIRNELDVPIVFSTAYTDQETVDRAKPTGPYGYLVKPFEHTALRITVETAMYRNTMERKLRVQERRLRSAQKMEAVGTLASGIAHDFNNILSAIIGYSEMGLQRVDESDSLYKMFDRIHRAGARAKNLVKLLLEFSRPANVDNEPVDMRDMVAEALEMLVPSLPARVEVVYAPPGMPCSVRADSAQLLQVVMNLVLNSVDAMRQNGGVLTLELSICEGGPSDEAVCGPPEDFEEAASTGTLRSVVLVVGDTGCGMAPEVCERVFDPFFTTKPSGEGTGLGLAVVHGVVQSYGGWIGLDTELGRGTRFTVGFPVVGESKV